MKMRSYETNAETIDKEGKICISLRGLARRKVYIEKEIAKMRKK